MGQEMTFPTISPLSGKESKSRRELSSLSWRPFLFFPRPRAIPTHFLPPPLPSFLRLKQPVRNLAGDCERKSQPLQSFAPPSPTTNSLPSLHLPPLTAYPEPIDSMLRRVLRCCSSPFFSRLTLRNSHFLNPFPFLPSEGYPTMEDFLCRLGNPPSVHFPDIRVVYDGDFFAPNSFLKFVEFGQ